jgi:hypothetical protein
LGVEKLLAKPSDGRKIVETTSKTQFDAMNIKSNGKSRFQRGNSQAPIPGEFCFTPCPPRIMFAIAILRRTIFTLILFFVLTLVGFAAAPYQIIVYDSWRDVLVGNKANGYSVNTTGRCTVFAALPIDAAGIRFSPVGTNSHVELTVGPFDTIFYLRDDPAFKRGDSSVTFHENNPATGAPMATFHLDWSTGVMLVGATIDIDAIDGEGDYGTPGAPGLTGIQDQIYFYFNIGNRASYTYNNLNIRGINTDREVTDPLGNPQSLEVGSVEGTVIITSPILSVDAPAFDTVVSATGNGKLLLSGSVTSVSPLQSIYYYINGDTGNELPIFTSSAQSVMSTDWSKVIELTNNGDVVQGSNKVSIIATDFYGGTETRSREFLYAFASNVEVRVTGQGGVTGLENGQLVNIGEAYTVTAKPDDGWILESWTDGNGNILSVANSFSYELTNNSVLIANFVSNPFGIVGGNYACLIYDTNGVAPASSGAISINLAPDGSYSGVLRVAEGSYPLTGQFELASNYDAGNLLAVDQHHVDRSGLPPFLVTLQLNVNTNPDTPGAGQLGAWIETFTDFSEEVPLWMSSIIGKRSSDVSNNIPPGLYNFEVLPVSTNSAIGPGGFSIARAEVAASGAVNFFVNLADGVTPTVSYASALAADGTAPYYSALYGGQGVFLGWFDFAPSNEPASQLTWIKPAGPGTFYPGGFSTNPQTWSSRYVAPKKGTNVIDGDTVTLTFNGGGLESEITADATFNPANNTFEVSKPSANKLALKFAPSTGLLTGTFVPPMEKKAARFEALWLPSHSNAAGFFEGTNETGSVIVTVP